MQKEITYKEALSKLAILCSRSEQCIQACKEKLSKWAINDTDANKIIDYLIQEKYIDEKRYALFFAKDKHQLSHWGKNKISHALQIKNIPSQYIETALAEINDNNYSSQLKSILTNKLKSIKAKNTYEMKAKLFRFGVGRGFESNLVLKTIDTILKKENINFTDNDEIYID